jgi:hypothetical protein
MQNLRKFNYTISGITEKVVSRTIRFPAHKCIFYSIFYPTYIENEASGLRRSLPRLFAVILN